MEKLFKYLYLKILHPYSCYFEMFFGLVIENRAVILFIIGLLVIVFTLLSNLRKKEEFWRVSGLFQSFCNEHQLAVFSGTGLLIFLITAFMSSLCEAILGFALLFNIYRLFWFFDRVNFPFMTILFGLSVVWRVWYYQQYAGGLFCAAILIFYAVNIVALFVDFSPVKRASDECLDGLKDISDHFLKEFKYFSVLQRAVALFFVIKLFIPNFFISLGGEKLEPVLTIIFGLCLLACLLVKNIIIFCFNPKTKAGLAVATACGTCVGALCTMFILDDVVTTRATTGGTNNPGSGVVTGWKQDTHVGFRATTGKALDLGIVYQQVNGKNPPLCVGSKHINFNATLSELRNETNPDKIKSINFLDPKIRAILDPKIGEGKNGKS